MMERGEGKEVKREVSVPCVPFKEEGVYREEGVAIAALDKKRQQYVVVDFERCVVALAVPWGQLLLFMKNVIYAAPTRVFVYSVPLRIPFVKRKVYEVVFEREGYGGGREFPGYSGTLSEISRDLITCGLAKNEEGLVRKALAAILRVYKRSGEVNKVE